MYELILNIFTVFAFILIGVLSLWSDHRSKANRSLFFMCFAGIFWMIGIFLGFRFAAESHSFALFSFRLSWGMGLLIAYYMFQFFYFFPCESLPLSLLKKKSLLVFILILSILSVFTPFISEEIIVGGYPFVVDVFGVLYPLYVLSLISLFILAAIFGILKLRKSIGIDRKKISFSLMGSMFAAIMAVTINAILPIFGIFILQRESVLIAIVLFLAFFYPMQKYRFFDLSLFVLKAFRYFLFVLVFILLVYGFYFIIPPFNSFLFGVLSASFATVFVYFLNKILPEFTSRDFREMKMVLCRLKIKMNSVDSYNKLYSLLEDAFVLSLYNKSVQLLLVSDSWKGKSIPIYPSDEFIHLLNDSSKDILILDELDFQRISKPKMTILSTAMRNLNSHLCLPLFSEGKLFGLFLLGSNSNNESYTTDQVDEILKFKQNIEVAFMNVLLKQNIHEANDLLRSIVVDKTRQLSDKVQQIERLVKQQSDFIAVTAHEFRTPLSIAIFQLSDTLDRCQNDPEITREMKIVEKSLDNLKILTQRLFDVQQYDLDKVDFNPNNENLLEFVNDISRNFTLSLSGNDIDFRFESKIQNGLVLNFDKSQIRQLLLNLLGNARKFVSESNGKISLLLTEDDLTVCIRVIDNACGISDADKNRIFDKFQTNSDQNSVGMGLGLYICKKIVELHDGEIWVEDSKDGGSEFCVQLRK